MTVETVLANIESLAYKNHNLMKQFVVICEVCRKYYEVDPDVFYNTIRTKKREAADSRAVAIYLGHKMYAEKGLDGWSHMASVLQMDHASMIHNNTKITSLLRFDKPMQMAVAEITEMLK